MSFTPFAHVIAGPNPAHDRAFCSDCIEVVNRYRDPNTTAFCFSAEDFAAIPGNRFHKCNGCDVELVAARRGVR